MSIHKLSLCLLTAVLALNTSVSAGTTHRKIHRTLHEGRAPARIQLRNIFARVRQVRLGSAPDRRVAIATMISHQGKPIVHIRPIGAPGNARVGSTRVHVHGKKWNFNTKRWQAFHLEVVVQVMAKRKAPRNLPKTRVLLRTVHLKVGQQRSEAVSRTLRAPVRKVGSASHARIVDAGVRKGLLHIRGQQPGRTVVMANGEYLDRRLGKWKRFRVMITVHVSR